MSMNSDLKSDKRKRDKADRRLAKKQNRVKQILITKGLTLVDCPTKTLCVYNAGLDNGVTKEQVFSLAHEYGNILEIVMIPKKPYSFVVLSNIIEAEQAYMAMSGVQLAAEDTSGTMAAAANTTLHTFFVDNAPTEETPNDPLPPGLILKLDFVSEEYEAELLAAIDWNDTSPGAQKDLKHRRVKHYGYEFLYGTNNVDPSRPLPQGIPLVCEGLIGRAVSSGLTNFYPDQLTVNQYSPGQGIPPHVDTPSAFEDGLMSLSLGSQVVMEFYHPDGRHVSVLLPQRSLLVMTGESRYIWSHGITPRKSDIVTSPDTGLTLVSRRTRTSLTFRKITGNQNSGEHTTSPHDSKIRQDRNNLISEEEAAVLETKHVHKVYEDIASHFSATRHSAWPRIAQFIKSLPQGSLLADIGCGNGKYLGLNQEIFEISSDRSTKLAGICAGRGHQTFVGDVLSIPLRSGMFDVCLCIAVIHHLSTELRRQSAMRELVRILAPGGHLLVYVWAMEQERNKVKSKYLKGTRRNGGQGHGQIHKGMKGEKQPTAPGDVGDGSASTGNHVKSGPSASSTVSGSREKTVSSATSTTSADPSVTSTKSAPISVTSTESTHSSVCNTELTHPAETSTKSEYQTVTITESVHPSATTIDSTHPSVTSAESEPISVTSTESAPISVTSTKSAPILVTSTKSAPISATSTESAPMSVTSTESVPILVTSTESAPISVTSTKSAPISVTSTESVPISVTSTESAPILVTSTESAPISVTSIKSAPILVTSTKSTPILVTSTESAPISVTSIKSAPILVTSTKSAPILVTSTKSAPILVTSTKSAPILVTSTESAPISVTSIKSASILVTSTKSAPILVTSTKSAPILVTSTKSAPILVTSTESVHPSATSIDSTHPSVISTESAPISVTSTESLISDKSRIDPAPSSSRVTDTPLLTTTKSEIQNCGENVNLVDDSDSFSNHLCVHVNRTQFKEQDLLVPWQLKNRCDSEKVETANETGESKELTENPRHTFHRYYHVFKQGELESLCQTLPNVVISKSYYDQGNWCVLLEKLKE